MVTVFLSFVLGDQREIKLFGIGLASAIFLDATIIRMVVVPAFMELFGDANWWLPRWLDRILPRVSVDVEHVGAAALAAGDVAPAEVAPVEATQVGAEPASANGRRRPTSKAKPKAPARKATAKPAAGAKAKGRVTAKAKPRAAAAKAKGKAKPAATRKRTPRER
jgi:hypothetical protein